LRIALFEQIGTEAAAITVSATNGRIILGGSTCIGGLPTRAEKVARGIKGVLDIDDRVISVPSHGRF
jgi:osmotically-inducible protein OsmY